jgi:hypothetical protein
VQALPDAARRSFRVRRALLLGLLLVLCAWRVADSLAAGAAFLAELSLKQRVDLLALDLGERTQRTLGADFELFVALQEVVPPGAAIVLSRRQADLDRHAQAELFLLRSRLLVLRYPADVMAVPGPLPGAADVAGLAGGETWVADLSPAEPFPAWPELELVREGERYRIWRLRGASR